MSVGYTILVYQDNSNSLNLMHFLGQDNFCLIHVSLIPVLGVVGEQVFFWPETFKFLFEGSHTHYVPLWICSARSDGAFLLYFANHFSCFLGLENQADAT